MLCQFAIASDRYIYLLNGIHLTFEAIPAKGDGGLASQARRESTQRNGLDRQIREQEV